MRFPFIALGLAIGIGLTGCGGGGGDDGPAGSSAGLYEGTTADGRTIGGLLLESGDYYFIYSRKNDPTLVGGFIRGYGFSNKGKFTSNNTRDFNFDGGIGSLTATLAANYMPKSSLNGTLNYILTTNSFTSRYNTDYEKTPTYAALDGTYTGQMGHTATVQSMTLTAAAGTISGTVGGTCTFSGTGGPLSTGNAYAIAITMSGSTCLSFLDNQILAGAAYLDATGKTLRLVATNGARTDGALFIGTKP